MKTQKLLGDVVLSKKSFTDLDTAFRNFEKKTFISLPDWRKSDALNGALFGIDPKGI